MHTPGHTFTHLSYVLSTADAPLGQALGVFSGGSLLFGATGRPDLLGPAHTETLARHQHGSAHRLAAMLPDEAEVLPTHGFGSFCAATQSDSQASTIGQERSANPVLTQDEDAYVTELLEGLGAWPAYYVHMAPANAAGPDAPDLSPPEAADPETLRARLEAGEWLVDLRSGEAFAAGHLRGSFNFGVDGQFATYLGWMIEWGTPVTLLGETTEQVAEAQRELVRIGIDRPAARAEGSPEDWALTPDDVVSFPRATFADLAQVRHHREVVVVDVRREEEHAEQAIEGAVNLPIHQLTRRLDEVPRRRAVGALRLGLPRLDRRLGPARGRAPRRGRRRPLRQRHRDRPAAHRLSPTLHPTPITRRGRDHVPTHHLQDLRQDHLGRLRHARRPGDGRRPPRGPVPGPRVGRLGVRRRALQPDLRSLSLDLD